MGRIATTILPADTSSVPEPGMGVPGPVGGQFGQQWDEQQYAPIQSAYQYGNPDALPQVKGPYKCLLKWLHGFWPLAVLSCSCLSVLPFYSTPPSTLHPLLLYTPCLKKRLQSAFEQ